MKGNTLTFHDKKSLAATRDARVQAALDAAFFMVNGIIWLFFLPYEFYMKLERSLKALKK
jgi:hypothetical protein